MTTTEELTEVETSLEETLTSSFEELTEEEATSVGETTEERMPTSETETEVTSEAPVVSTEPTKEASVTPMESATAAADAIDFLSKVVGVSLVIAITAVIVGVAGIWCKRRRRMREQHQNDEAAERVDEPLLVPAEFF